MSDYSPPYTEEDAKWEKRRDTAVLKIRRVPAKNLTVGNILDVIEALHDYTHDMNEHDVKVVEKILGAI